MACSCLAGLEPMFIGAMDAVLAVLRRLQADNATREPRTNKTALRGWDLLERNIESLLGVLPPNETCASW